jgi:two-component system osmolarity sensor histidine kinase EnvZ
MRRLRDLLPKGLRARTLAMIILPVAIMQVAVVYGFFDQHWRTVTARLTQSTAGDVAYLVRSFEADPQGFDSVSQRFFETADISADFAAGEALPSTLRPAFFTALDRMLRRALEANLDNEFWFDTTRYPAYVDIRVAASGGVLRLIVQRDQVFAPTGYIFLFWLAGATVLLTAVSILFIKNQVRAVLRLSEAAEAFGKGRDIEGFKPAGATEVRRAAQSFIEMRDRLRAHMEQRTALLASVSHDLRTPLTRLKLALAMAPQGAWRDEAQGEIGEMAAMLDEYLAFARGQGEGEPVEADIASIARQAMEAAARGGADIALDVAAESGALSAPVRALALRRCIANLLDNAASFGTQVRIQVRRHDGAVEVLVDDDGPGIPPDRREQAFAPFSRLDDSRNQNRAGVGLGLAIARDVARGHGGDVTLEDSPLGGLRARLRIPV